jgi:hypothetical protein
MESVNRDITKGTANFLTFNHALHKRIGDISVSDITGITVVIFSHSDYQFYFLLYPVKEGKTSTQLCCYGKIERQMAAGFRACKSSTKHYRNMFR